MKLRHVKFDVVDEVATLTLNRPEARNALSPEMRTDIDACLEEIKARQGNGIQALVITGEGRAFCAGGDIKAMAGRTRADAIGRRNQMRSAHKRLYDLLHLEVPVIAAVNGHAAGAGFAFALMSDFIFASPATRFANSFGRIGLVPDWAGLYTLPRIVGLGRAKELVFTSRRFDADEGKAMGIVHTIVPNDDDLLAQAQAFAARFRDASTHSIGLAKNILLQSFEQDLKTMLEFEAFGQGISYSNPYHATAVERFREKAPAAFDWEKG
ncbi:MAG: 2-(1,2-epoxy-1,2-dihydrophenyl)acetyl-CoA isomerase [Gammaproteobacteria bacterium]|jgi:2-(1,2-epoxy-1,2-dihydrophenyl)acetyl-CoA isomerase